MIGCMPTYQNNTSCTSPYYDYIGYSNASCATFQNYDKKATIVINMTLEEYKEYIYYKRMKEADESLNKNIWKDIWVENN